MKTNIMHSLQRKMLLSLLLVFSLTRNETLAFCGFYVAKADATLFNTTSQVIMVRDGNKSTITMSSDFKGDVRDFAMVVPVPVILQRDQIRTVAAGIFQTLDTYSSPRLVEYYDQNPCQPQILFDAAKVASSSKEEMAVSPAEQAEKRYHVKVEAQYTVDEYDILILSAEESNGLERWLVDNGYKIPAGAREVLQPYIHSGMKFFVVKVNLDQLSRKGTELLSPLQLNFQSPKFMLPIRLGMVNAQGAQDMIVYAFTKSGRVETSNYRTVKVPTGTNIPEFVQPWFGKFYVDVYRKHRREAGEGNVYLEYAWNIGGNMSVKCDPCNGPPPMVADLLTAGVDWIQQEWGNYTGEVFFTRLHVTYDRKHFPQDLFFEETPNRENFQARFVITHPAYDHYTCEEGKKYVKQVLKRRNEELNNLAILTNWDVSAYAGYAAAFEPYSTGRQPQQRRVVVEESPKELRPDTLEKMWPGGHEFGSSNELPIDQAAFALPVVGEKNSNSGGGNRSGILVLCTLCLILALSLVVVLRRRKWPAVK
jgi:hypothetical protein